MKERIIWLDNIKGLLIFLVVLGHCLQFSNSEPDSCLLYNFIYSFHMPLFMCLSGYACYKKEVNWNVIPKRAKQLLLPFVTFNIINSILTHQAIWDYVINPQIGLWFLWVLFFITLLHTGSIFVSKLLKIKEEIFILISFVFVLAIIKILGLTYFGIDMISSFWLYYALGFYIRKYDIVSELSKTGVCILLLILASPLSLTFHRNGDSIFSFIPNFLFIRIVAIVCSLAFIGLFAKVGNRNNHIISKIGGGVL